MEAVQVAANADEIRRALSLLLEAAQVTELRALNVRTQDYRQSRTVSGFYDSGHIDEMTRDAMRVAPYASGVYFTPNPLHPGILARAPNRLGDISMKSASDTDVIDRTCLLVDFDAVRPSDVSSSEAEYRASHEVAQKVAAELARAGWPEPVYACSGNGAHLVWRIALPAADNEVVKRCLEALAARYDTPTVHVDRKVFNPARIWKLYGTVARKGESLPDRPHRLAQILTSPVQLQAVPNPLLLALAQSAAKPAPRPAIPSQRPAHGADDGVTFQDAAEKYNADHAAVAEEWPTRPGACPACGTAGGFHRYPADSLRWVCFSERHNAAGMPGVKTQGGNNWSGDILDLDCHRLGVTRLDRLVGEGYLQPRSQSRPAPPSERPPAQTPQVKPEARVLPHDLAAERAVLAAILADPQAIFRVGAVLEPEDFYHPKHVAVYREALGLADTMEPIDQITLPNALAKVGVCTADEARSHLQKIIEKATPGDVEHHARIVQSRSMARKIIASGQDLIEGCYRAPDSCLKLAEQAERAIFDLTKRATVTPVYSMSSIVAEQWPRLQALSQARSPITGVPSGLLDLDELTSGFQRSDLIIVAGRPSMGKTALALNIVQHAATHDVPVLVFSLEMARDQLADRLVSMESQIDLRLLRTGRWASDRTKDLEIQCRRLAQMPIWVSDSLNCPPREMRAKARRLKSTNNLGLIVLDYIGLMENRDQTRDNRQVVVSAFSRGLKMLAREVEVPVIALCQLSRKVEERTDRRPMLSDLRESGAIEQDADVVVFVYRDEYYHANTTKRGTAELIVAKQRNGPTGTALVSFQAAIGKFANLARETQEEYQP